MGARLAGAVVEAFGLGRALGEVVPHVYSSMPTWRLDTVDGPVLVTLVPGDGRERLAEAMAFEARARRAGVAMPVPVPPVAPAFGYAAEVPGFGAVRAYEWIDGRPLDDTDDVAEWLGWTLATLHGIEPLARAEPACYGLHPERQWREWLAAGQATGRGWAPALARHLDDVLATTRWVAEAFRRAGGYVVTHRDVEPWNVLVGAGGPVLVDWDAAGPDSAGLEASHAIVVFALRGRAGQCRHGRAAGHRAEPDRQAVRRAADVYRQHGGRPAVGPDALARRAGLRLSRLGERLAITLGHLPPGSVDLAAAEARAAERVAGLATFVADLIRWSDLLG